MKHNLITNASSKLISSLLAAAACCSLYCLPVALHAQADSTKKTTAAVEAIAITPSMTFLSVQKADNTIELKSALQVKQKGVSIKLPFLKVKYLLITDTASKELGAVITDRNGKASLSVKTDALLPDKEGKLHFKAVFAGNKQAEAVEAEAIVKKANLSIAPVKQDSSLSANIKLTDAASGAAVAKVTVGVYVKRSFNALKIGEATTDDKGEGTVEIPHNLPGDVKGDITLIARVDENETYGNLEASSKQAWGEAVSDKTQKMPRALWSTHPPLWMLFTFLILVTTVWGHYIVIIYELFRLRKEEPHTAPTIAN